MSVRASLLRGFGCLLLAALVHRAAPGPRRCGPASRSSC